MRYHEIVAEGSGALADVDHVAALIQAAGFDDHDRDMGTAGFCGMFALALYRALRDRSIPCNLVLVCPTREGKTTIARDGGLVWRHAAVASGGRLYDIEGHVLPADVIANYVYGDPKFDGGTIVQVSLEEFTSIMRKTRNAVDGRSLARWKKQLAGAPATI